MRSRCREHSPAEALWSNGIGEQFHTTVPQEFYPLAFGKKLDASPDCVSLCNRVRFPPYAGSCKQIPLSSPQVVAVGSRGHLFNLPSREDEMTCAVRRPPTKTRTKLLTRIIAFGPAATSKPRLAITAVLIRVEINHTALHRRTITRHGDAPQHWKEFTDV